MRRTLGQLYHAQQFHPGWLGAFVNPFYLARRALWSEIQDASTDLAGPLLDVGCGSKPYRSLFVPGAYVGLDIDTPETRRHAVADAYYDGGRFPFDDASFRGVLCNQVLEHVFNPDEFVEEIRRVLSPGGRLLLTVPFVWDEHEQPYDYARYSSFGLKALLQRHGFTVLRQRKLLGDISVLFQLLNAYLFKVTQTRFFMVNLLRTAVFLAPVSIMGRVFGAMLPANPDLFLDQVVLAERNP